jgi:F0F1-type ATP synthase assembly protein I
MLYGTITRHFEDLLDLRKPATRKPDLRTFKCAHLVVVYNLTDVVCDKRVFAVHGPKVAMDAHVGPLLALLPFQNLHIWTFCSDILRFLSAVTTEVRV